MSYDRAVQYGKIDPNCSKCYGRGEYYAEKPDSGDSLGGFVRCPCTREAEAKKVPPGPPDVPGREKWGEAGPQYPIAPATLDTDPGTVRQHRASENEAQTAIVMAISHGGVRMAGGNDPLATIIAERLYADGWRLVRTVTAKQAGDGYCMVHGIPTPAVGGPCPMCMVRSEGS